MTGRDGFRVPAGRVLGRYARVWDERHLYPDEYVTSSASSTRCDQVPKLSTATAVNHEVVSDHIAGFLGGQE